MIHYKSPREIEKMRAAGKVLVGALGVAAAMVKPGVTTGEIDAAVEKFIRENRGVPTFKGYRNFPKSICASVNEEVVHGIPGTRVLREGDIFTVDVGVTLEGYIADSAWTYPVGRISTRAQRLLKSTQQALSLAIEQVRPGNKLSQVSAAVQSYAEANGYTVVRKYAGHGVGRDLHEEPQVPNYVDRMTSANDLVLKPGLVIAIEPMLNEGTHDVKTLSDNWTVVTKDGKLSAHYEHTVAVTEAGHEILTAA